MSKSDIIERFVRGATIRRTVGTTTEVMEIINPPDLDEDEWVRMDVKYVKDAHHARIKVGDFIFFADKIEIIDPSPDED